jgi:histidyl-tRNA synthetase
MDLMVAIGPVENRCGIARCPVYRRLQQVERILRAQGVPDYVPPDSARFIAVGDGLLDAARRAGYSDIELPIFEDIARFARGVGESTDVVSKEMYTFAGRGDRSVTLRPEGTAGVVRAVTERGLDRGALPVKLCATRAPFSAIECPQAGRYASCSRWGWRLLASMTRRWMPR